MRVGTIQGSSQAQKNRLLYETVKKYATGHEVVNFGCHMYEAYSYSYVEISVLIGLLIASGSVDLIKRMDREMINTIMQKEDVLSFVLSNGRDQEISDWIRSFIDNGY